MDVTADQGADSAPTIPSGQTPSAVEPPTDRAGDAVSPSVGAHKRSQSVLVVICTRGGEFLLLRRARPRQFWQSVTGSLNPGESPRQAALRELREETGLEAGSALIDLRRSVLFPILRSWQGRYAPRIRFNREYWFALILDTRRLIHLDPTEHLEYRWLPAHRAAVLATSWSNRDAIRALAAC